jgi:hypothetical protein
VPLYAKLSIRRPKDKREETNEITPWKRTHGVCLGEGSPDLRSCRSRSPRTR